MCVGLSAKVVKISNGTAVIDAGGAKREVSSKLLENLEPWFMQAWPSQRSQKRMTARQSISWRNFYNEDSQRDN